MVLPFQIVMGFEVLWAFESNAVQMNDPASKDAICTMELMTTNHLWAVTSGRHGLSQAVHHDHVFDLTGTVLPVQHA